MHDIKIHDVSFSYAGSDKLVLKDINVDVEGGEFVCILGQSGCGKSTLLRLIAGLEDCTTGEILVDGEKIHGASLNRGVVFQDYGLFPWKTAGANITLALKKKFPDWDKNHLKERTIELLKAVGLDESVYRKYPKELSGGMKQRCAIASAFGIDPPILLMDEPFGALDAVTRSMLQDMVLKLWEKQEDKKTVFFVTHDVDEAKLLLKSLIRAEQWYLANKEECVKILAKEIGAEEDYVAAYLLNDNYVSSVDPCKNSVVKTWEAMIKMGFIDQADADKINIEDHINTELYKEALDECVTEYRDEDPDFYDGRVKFFEENDQ